MHSEFGLKVLSLIGSLKNEIDTLKEEVARMRDQIQNIQPQSKPDSERLSINDVRDYIKQQLLSHYPNLQFTNGSRSKGKLTISDGSSTIERILIRTSKSFREKDGYPSGWITIHKDLIDEYELYFFVVKDFDGELHSLALNKMDIANWISHKSPDSNGNYHFYINLIHGKWIDDREGTYDCSRYYNNWSVVSELLGNL
ncbi:hypothetical protein M4D70_19010 [Brevibacillus borstelensis]|uniref:hypothetical protein n=1 Tax=Brevibacillus borstelensis TaxID=45462 RepID=UPI0020425BF0|nr:hypothetical protein [Brevibacillus borstelensis]MCM3624320.1 hypothetical protein [Brevibacillus borstelensis]